ncbi:MAG: Xaa-Pro peptidase family protein [Syntrophales bacterium]|nr:Xaa-Pro peptidase family protein [Syntrophales bacterium]HPL62727.1 Xaa-Pro peptidase family protein [Syntrophales bacterium]
MSSRLRIESLQALLRNRGPGSALLCYSRNILYYTGTAQPSWLVVSPDYYGLFVRSGLDFALREVNIPSERVTGERKLERIRDLAGEAFGSEPIGVELDILTAEQYLLLRRTFPGREFVNVSGAVLEQRKSKDESEIERIEAACDAVHAGHLAAVAALREGISELELAAAVENAHRLAGHEGTFFIRQPDFFMSRGPLASGPNLLRPSGVVYTITGVGLSPSVPAGPSKRLIARGDLVMVDIPTLVDGYHADQTRTYCLGRAAAEAREMYGGLKQIADRLAGSMRPGMTGRRVYSMAEEAAKELGMQNEFQSFGRGRKARIIGHGIGLELNEPPVLSDSDNTELSENSVIAIDMHMMNDKCAVKLEDMVLVRSKGNRILTKSPRELIEV